MKNFTTITGRLTADPDTRNFQDGKYATKFTLATSTYFKAKVTSFIKCVAWNNVANFPIEYFKKGDLVTVSGELKRKLFNDKPYYELSVYSTGFTCFNKVITGYATGIDEEHKLLIQTDEEIIKVNYNSDIIPTDTNTFILSVAIVDNEPVYNFVGSIR